MTATGFVVPAISDLPAVIGADWSMPFKFWTDTAQTVPFDLTGNTCTLQIGSSANSVQFTLTSGSGLVITTGTGGSAGIIATLTDAQTATVGDAGPTDTLTVNLPYYLKFVDVAGLISFPVKGDIVFATP